jgi:MAF protein
MLVLASNSPRRRQLFALGGWVFNIVAVEIDERPLSGESPRDYVLRLAENKARAVASQVGPDSLVVAADTTVVDGLDILGKPADEHEAMIMLTRLRGHIHQVYTAIAVLYIENGLLLKDICVTDVPMRDYSDQEIHEYIAGGDPLDKAGAYAIQHNVFHPVYGLAGCFANVMGLPLCHLTRTLHKLRIDPQHPIPQACQSTLEYDCPIFERVLQGYS